MTKEQISKELDDNMDQVIQLKYKQSKDITNFEVYQLELERLKSREQELHRMLPNGFSGLYAYLD